MRILLAIGIALGGVSLATQQGATLDDLARRSLTQIEGDVPVAGLKADVQVTRDTWGIPHIYARSDEDLFFAQGFVVAQDRLWQMEIWRRTAEGRLAEIFGAEAVGRDRIARLLKYRGPFDDKEWTSYHPEARRLITAFVRRHQRVHRLEREPAAGRIRADRHQAGTLDGRNAAAAAGLVRRRDGRTAARTQRRQPRCRSRKQAAESRSLGRPEGSRRLRLHRSWTTRSWPRRDPAAAAAAAGGRRSCRNIVPLPAHAVEPDTSVRRTGKQQLGRQRQAVGDGQARRRQRSASRGHASRRCATSFISTRPAGT